MGCDIHAYIQYQENELFYEGWRMPFRRNYFAFSLLAGVRGDRAVFPQKGIPKELAYYIRKDYLYFITDTVTDEPGYCTQAKAEKWVKNGCSTKWDSNHVTNPDAHSPSWLTTKELKKVYDTYNEAIDVDWAKYTKETKPKDRMQKSFFYRERTCLHMHMILKNMQELEKCGYKDKVQFVFWFDN